MKERARRRPRKLTEAKAKRIQRVYPDAPPDIERDAATQARRGRNTQGDTRRP